MVSHLQTSRVTAPATLALAAKTTRSYAADAKASPTEVSSILEQRIRGVQEEAGLAETGRVLSVGYVSKSPSTLPQVGDMSYAESFRLTEMASLECTAWPTCRPKSWLSKFIT